MAVLTVVASACALTPASFTTPDVTATIPGESSAGIMPTLQPTPVAQPLPATDVPTGLLTTPVAVTPDGLETPFLSPTPDKGFPAETQPGQVTIEISQKTDPRGQPIKATVLNGLAQPIYTSDMKTDCSILTLERFENQSWESVPGCNSLRAPQSVEIGAKHGKAVLINPLSTNFGIAPGTNTPAFGPGTFRFKFTYRLAPEPEGEEPLAVFSETFVIPS